MAFRTLSLAGVAIAAALLAPSLSAQSYDGAGRAYSGQAYTYAAGPARDRDGYPRAGSRRDARYDQVLPPARRTDYRERRARRCPQDDAGTLLGAIAGGLLGDPAVGRHGSHAAGSPTGRDCD
jgi:hypothetical protein